MALVQDRGRRTLRGEAGAEHALASAVLARRESGRRRGTRGSTDAPQACPVYQPGEERTSVGAGFLDPDVTETGSGEIMIADFGVDRRSVKDSARRDPTLQTWLRTFETDESYRLRIVGYSDCHGTNAKNTHLRQSRALRVEQLLGAGARSRVDFRGMAALDSYLSDNATAVGRARNRAVVIEFRRNYDFEDETVPTYNCRRPMAATALNDYVNLVMCAERALPGYTPRQMLSLLRQLYYSNASWSRCRGAGCQFWSNVITCGVSVADPRTTLGIPLYTALRDSQVVAGVDLGHVFTGLESMLCPRTSVELEVPGPNWTMRLPNEDFATWAGDLGSAAAQRVHDEHDLGRSRQPWSRYFGTSGSLASEEDLTGDIDAFVVRAALSGRACGGTAATRMPSLRAPISQILFELYEDASSTLGSMRADGIRCFVEALGGRVGGSRITNRSDFVDRLTIRVNTFAADFYRLKWHRGYFATAGIGSALLVASRGVTEEFVRWLEARL